MLHAETAIEVCNSRWWDTLTGWELTAAACIIIPTLAVTKFLTIWVIARMPGIPPNERDQL